MFAYQILVSIVVVVNSKRLLHIKVFSFNTITLLYLFLCLFSFVPYGFYAVFTYSVSFVSIVPLLTFTIHATATTNQF